MPIFVSCRLVRKSVGYGIVLAIALAGTSGGMAWAKHHQRLATDYANQIRSQTETIQQLQVNALETQLELRSLITYTDQPNQFIAKNYQLHRHLKKVNEDLQQLMTDLVNGDDTYQQQLSILLENYASSFEKYQQQIDQLVFDIDQILFQGNDPTLSEAQKIKVTADILDRYLQAPLFRKFNQLPRRLNPLAKDAQSALARSPVIATAKLTIAQTPIAAI
jgi:hypothetical protein